MSYFSLHNYTGYTFLSSSLKVDLLIKLAKTNKQNILGICDKNVLFGLPEFNKKCLENDIYPIFGMDLDLNYGEENFSVCLFIKNEKGYLNLSYLSSTFQKNNSLKLEENLDKFDGLICVLPSSSAFLNKLDTKKIIDFKNLFEEFYLGLEIYSTNDNIISESIRNFAIKNYLECIPFPLAKYAKKEDASLLTILDSIKSTLPLERNVVENLKKQNGDFYYKNNDEINTLYTKNEIENLNKLRNHIDFSFNKKRGQLLSVTNSLEESTKLLKEKIIEGLKIRNIDLESSPEYRNRLNKEFLVIQKMGYQDYFLIVQDYVLYAKNNNILVGPGRGSAAGCLIAYLLQITEVDPLKYNLLFERFLNPNRKSMPDIDVDFSDIHRDTIFKYIADKYGQAHSARVIAFQTLGAKQSIRDVTRALGYDVSQANEICSKIPSLFKKGNYTILDAYKELDKFKQLIDENADYKIIIHYAHLLEGLPRQKGLHAAGIIIDNNPLIDSIPLTYDANDICTIQYEKDYIEDLGYLKMDILGLTNLTTIYDCLNKIKQNRNIDLNLNIIDYNDSNIYRVIEEKRVMGLFQLDTSAAMSALNKINPTNFNEVVATISLDRPGPMDNIPLYVERKKNPKHINYLDKRLEPILKETYGIIVYQEQIMQIARVLANFSFAEADSFRRAIAKKHKDEIIKLKDSFLLGCQKNNVSSKVANQIFSDIEKFAGYGFNKSHSVAYGMIALQEAYLKTYYPLEFYLSILDQQYGSNDAKFNQCLNEIKKAHLKITLPNINKSTFSFIEDGDNLLMPLSGINSFPIKMIDNILKERNKNGDYTSFINFIERLTSPEYGITQNQVIKLIDAGCFDSLNPNRKSLKQSVEPAFNYIDLKFKGLEIGNDYHEIDVPDDPLERIINEYNSLGVMLSDTLLHHIKKESLENKVITPISKLKLGVPSSILGTISSFKEIQIKQGEDKGKHMVFLLINDDSEEIEATIFARLYSKIIQAPKLSDIVLVTGKLTTRMDKQNFLIDEIKIMEEGDIL